MMENSKSSSYEYDVTDGNGGVTPQTATITIAGVNDVPNAIADRAETTLNSPVLIDVTRNDLDPDINDTLTAALGTVAPQFGTVAMAGNDILYIPNPGFLGTDSFTYVVDDGTATSTEATVTVRVFNPNPGPFVTGDVTQVLTEDDAFTTISLLLNAIEPEGDPMGAVNLLKESGDDSGIVHNRNTNQLEVTPSVYNHLAVGESETVVYSYQVSDGRGNSVDHRMTVVISGVNDVPVTVDDVVTTPESTPVIIDILANDNDPDLTDVLTPSVTSGPANGSTVVNPDGTSLTRRRQTTAAPIPTPTSSTMGRSTLRQQPSTSPLLKATIRPWCLYQPSRYRDRSRKTPLVRIDLLQDVTDEDGDPLFATNFVYSMNPSRGITFDSTTNELVVNPMHTRDWMMRVH